MEALDRIVLKTHQPDFIVPEIEAILKDFMNI
jgi:formate-dependent phosphoribosylglycinamide formyltransferase (GAR transformylase)